MNDAHAISRMADGLRVVTLDMPGMESVAMGLWVGSGGRHEPRRLNGISHFLEHILFKGTRTRSAKCISQTIESVGGSLNGFTGEEFTCYTAQVPRRHTRLAAAVLFDMFLHPAVRTEDVEKERAVIREEINMGLDTPQTHVFDLLNGALWGDHPLGRPLIGTVKTIGGISRRDLRTYHRRQYDPSNAVFAAAGPLRHGAVERMVRGMLPRRDGSRPPAFRPAADRRRRPAVLLLRKETEQTHLTLGMRAFRRDHPDRYALQLLSIALGGNMSSRLFQRIRERHGLAYAIHASVIRYRDTGALAVYAGVENAKAGRVISMIVGELARLRDGDLRAAELERAREYYRGQVLMQREKTMRNMLAIGESLLCTGRVLTTAETLSNISRVRLEDVRRVAARVLGQGGINLAAIGPLPIGDDAVRNLLRQ
ncbi:MAG: pitrilysin family protein [bacterium]|nr:pitrilysin family protein [bacterium]